MRTLVFVFAAMLILLVTWCCIASRFESPALRPSMNRPADADVMADLDGFEVTQPSRSRASASGSESDIAHVEMDDAALLGLLRAAGRAWSEGDTQALTGPLEALLSSPHTPRRVLEMLEQARLRSGSQEQQGAILAIGFGLAHAGRTGALALDGRPLTRDVLESLTRIEHEPGVALAQFASRLRAGDRLSVGAKWIATIVSLRERVPEHAENLEPFLRAILDGDESIEVPAEDLPALSLVVSTSNDPLAVEAALAVLVAGDPDLFIPIAEDLRAHSGGNRELRLAAVGAVAARAPVDAAAASMARMASSELYAQFAQLGSRDGGMEAAQKQYSALVAANSDPDARKMLVSAMGAEKTDVLVGIAQTDPDPTVRHQALLTASLQPLETDSVMRAVRAEHSARSNSGGGFSTHSGLMVAENVLLNGTGSARADAVDWLKQVVIDPGESLADRKNAWNKLRARGLPSEFAGIDEPR